MHTSSGGTAFPHDTLTFNIPGMPAHAVPPSQGLTKRQLFAALAPAQIPDWFDITFELPQPVLPSVKELADEGDRQQFIALHDGKLDVSAASFAAIGLFREYQAALALRQTWYRDKEAARYFGWRWYYADQMLATQAGA